MKYMFASDVHGSAYYCRKMLETYKKEQAERLVLLGDLLRQQNQWNITANFRQTVPTAKYLS